MCVDRDKGGEVRRKGLESKEGWGTESGRTTSVKEGRLTNV